MEGSLLGRSRIGSTQKRRKKFSDNPVPVKKNHITHLKGSEPDPHQDTGGIMKGKPHKRSDGPEFWDKNENNEAGLENECAESG